MSVQESKILSAHVGKIKVSSVGQIQVTILALQVNSYINFLSLHIRFHKLSSLKQLLVISQFFRSEVWVWYGQILCPGAQGLKSAGAGLPSGAQGPLAGSFSCWQYPGPCGLFEILIPLLAVDGQCSQHLEALVKALLCGHHQILLDKPSHSSLPFFLEGPSPS